MHSIRQTITALIIVGAMAGTVACVKAKADAKAATTAFIDCTKAADASKIIGDVAALILGGGSGWQSNLESLGLKVGGDALACAVKSVETVLASEMNGSGAKSTGAASPARQRASQAIAAHGWHFAE